MAAPPKLNPNAALGLAAAVVGSSTAPVLLLDGDLKVVAVSDSFCRAFGAPTASVVGQEIFALGAGEWDIPQLRSLLKSTASGDAEIEAYELDIEPKGQKPRRLVLNARNLSYGDAENTRLMLTIADVTDARLAEKLKEDLVREKGVLLQELQHRVANSLQIIASVILQTARRAQSEETRAHLTDAHSRVMSVAALQTQLSSARMGDVALGAYFGKLCESIGASMIRDHNNLSLTVDADASQASADVSVSLGLIITELVINALKHAFPDGRSGKIVVGYRSQGLDWTLSVTDNGVGIPTDAANAPPGLGTSIVQALAHQLDAEVFVASAAPGTSVSIVHSEAAAAGARTAAV